MKPTAIALAGVLVFLFGSAKAGLSSRLDGKAVYDSDLNITWLADANYYAVTDAPSNGAIVWSTAWWSMKGIDVGGFRDWRLPRTLEPDPSCSRYSTLGTSSGFNCTGSEMGHLFYEELGGVPGSSILSVHNGNLSLFSNVQDGNYWSGTEVLANNGNVAWVFGFGSGFQGGGGKNDNLLYAWAVRDGDVAAPIPEPETYAMMLAGLALVGLAARRRKQKH